MPEPLEVEAAIFMRAARDELLSIASGEDDPFRPHRARRLAAALQHLIVRAESDREVSEIIAPKVRAVEQLVGASLQSSRKASAEDWLAEAARACARAAREENAGGRDRARIISAIRDVETARREYVRGVTERIERNDAEWAASSRRELPPLTSEEVEQFLRARFPHCPNLRVERFTRPKGVYSKENYAFDIVGLEPRVVHAVLRRDRSFEIVPSSAADEFELLNHLHAQGLPVARCIAAQHDDAPPLHRPSLIMERVPGVALARVNPKTLEKVSAAATPEVVLKLAEPLARLHQQDVSKLPLSKAPLSMTRRESFLRTLDDYHERLHRHQRQSFPLVEAAVAWLYNNAHVIDESTTLVHADYDLRNVLFEDGRLTAVLDFELAHIGHPAEDLGYLRKDLEELMPWKEFMDAYYAAGGARVSEEVVRYFQVWAVVFHGICNIIAFSGYRGGVHSDVFLGTVSFVEFERVQQRLIALLSG